MSKTKARLMANHAKGSAYLSGGGYKYVKRVGSKYGWKFEDGKTTQSKGGYDSPEEAAFGVDEFLRHYIGPNAETNQALGFLKDKQVAEIRQKLEKMTTPKVNAKTARVGSSGYKGVSIYQNKKTPYKAQGSVNGKYRLIGNYRTPEEAARAYDNFVLKHLPVGSPTNISLGLLPPLGDIEACNALNEKIRLAHEELDRINSEQPTTKPGPKAGKKPTSVKPPVSTEPEPESAPEVPAQAQAPAPAPTPAIRQLPQMESPQQEPVAQNQELIVMSEAEKLRRRAVEMLQEASEKEASQFRGEIRAQLASLTATIGLVQNTLMSLIDCVAEMEAKAAELEKLI